SLDCSRLRNEFALRKRTAAETIWLIRQIRNRLRRTMESPRDVTAALRPNDFMPLEGWHHLELIVGNAKQAAYFYERAFGFRRSGYAGPETGLRDRASYLLEQGEIRLVVTTGLRSDSEITRFVTK